MKEIKDYLHLYLGCEVEVDQSEYIGTKQVWKYIGTTLTDNFPFINVVKDGNHQSFHRTPVKPILRPLSDMTEEEILNCGKYICAIPNEKDYDFEIQRTHNSVGAKFFSGKYTSGQYFSIWNEKNKPNGIGHIEVGWYNDDKIDRRKTKELWKVGGCHDLTIYLLSKHFDLFGLIEAGLAIDKTTLKQ